MFFPYHLKLCDFFTVLMFLSSFAYDVSRSNRQVSSGKWLATGRAEAVSKTVSETHITHFAVCTRNPFPKVKCRQNAWSFIILCPNVLSRTSYKYMFCCRMLEVCSLERYDKLFTVTRSDVQEMWPSPSRITLRNLGFLWDWMDSRFCTTAQEDVIYMYILMYVRCV
jgi:hypothetical protein